MFFNLSEICVSETNQENVSCVSALVTTWEYIVCWVQKTHKRLRKMRNLLLMMLEEK